PFPILISSERACHSLLSSRASELASDEGSRATLDLRTRSFASLHVLPRKSPLTPVPLARERGGGADVTLPVFILRGASERYAHLRVIGLLFVYGPTIVWVERSGTGLADRAPELLGVERWV